MVCNILAILEHDRTMPVNVLAAAFCDMTPCTIHTTLMVARASVTSVFLPNYTAQRPRSSKVKVILIIIINCNWVVTRWQWLFYMYTKHEIGY